MCGCRTGPGLGVEIDPVALDDFTVVQVLAERRSSAERPAIRRTAIALTVVLGGCARVLRMPRPPARRGTTVIDPCLPDGVTVSFGSCDRTSPRARPR